MSSFEVQSPAEQDVIDLLAGGGSHWWRLEQIIEELEEAHGRYEAGQAVMRLRDDGYLACYEGRRAVIYTLNALGQRLARRQREHRGQMVLSHA